MSVGGGMVGGMLTVKDTMTLEFERQWWAHPGAKDKRIRETFDESTTRYYQRLNSLIDRPEAMAYDALTVKRLQRLRDARAAQRSTARVTFSTAGHIPGRS